MDKSNPASVDLATGELFLNEQTFPKLKPSFRKMILLHELAHLKLQTFDEFEADKFALEVFLRTGGNKKDAIKSLSHTLDGNNPEHFARLNERIKQIQSYQLNYSGQPTQPLTAEQQRLLAELERLNREILQDDAAIAADERAIAVDDGKIFRFEEERQKAQLAKEAAELKINLQCDDLKNNKRKRNCKADAMAIVEANVTRALELQDLINQFRSAKSQKIQRKNQRAAARAYKKERVGDALLELAKNCIDGRSQLAGQVLGGIGNIATQVGGMVSGVPVSGGQQPAMMGGCQQPFAPQPTLFAPGEDGNNNFGLIILVLTIAVVGFLFFQNKNKR